jgi:glycosyltransferase involved in cell wall biosynthesis
MNGQRISLRVNPNSKSATKDLDVPKARSHRLGLQKPRICILVDRPEWAYHHSARHIAQQLVNEFDIILRYAVNYPQLSLTDFDLIQICFWEECRYQLIGLDRQRIIKMVSSHRWQEKSAHGPCSTDEFARRYLMNCDTVICTSPRLATLIEKVFPRVFYTPNGVDVSHFKPGEKRSGPDLIFGWAGNAKDELKGFKDIVEPACGGQFTLATATGGLTHTEMADFYRRTDVFIVASRNEGEPLTLIEAMASGCFPVCVDVGIVPDLIKHGQNGYIVPQRTVEAFQAAFQWCVDHYDKVRAAGWANADLIARERSWSICAESFARVYRDTLARAARLPKPPPFSWLALSQIWWHKMALVCRHHRARVQTKLRSGQ